MTQTTGLLGRLKARGEEVFAQISNELMANPHFMKAMEGALRGKHLVDEAVGRVLKTMNLPTRIEFKKALGRIEALEREVTALKARPRAPGRRKASDKRE